MDRIPKILLSLDTSRQSNREILYGITKYSRIHGPWELHREPPFYKRPKKNPNAVVAQMGKIKPDAIITQEPEKYKSLIDTGIPTFIAIHLRQNYPGGIPRQIAENEAIGIMGADHLLERGFKNFAYCGVIEMPSSIERCESFVRRVGEKGLPCNVFEEPKSRAKRSWDAEQPLLEAWLKSLPKPVGIMTSYDERSDDVVQACKSAGLRIPEHVAIIGVDDDQLICETSNPPLSSIALNFERAGYEIAELLDRLIKGEKMIGQIIRLKPTHVVSRQSTDLLASDDANVAEAVHYINNNYNKPIQVSDVVQATSLSRRSLEQRFQNILNQSIHEKIINTRIEYFARMLIETNLNVSQIVKALNFASLKHISRCFRKKKGMTPLQYRREFGPK